MARFLAIVIVLVAVALLINNWQNKKAVNPDNEDATALVEPQETDETKDEGKESQAAATAPSAGTISKTVTPNLSESSVEAAPAEVIEPTTEAEVSESESAVEVVNVAEVAQAEEIEHVKEENPLAGVALPDSAKTETVKLGGNVLLQGIPGEGDLTLEQIKIWLSAEANRVVLKPELPLGLAAGAAAIQGIEESPLTRAKIELGRQLYFDTRLSTDETISCASCHDPEFGYAKNTRFGVGVKGQEGARNSPVAYNRILSGAQFWDGRASSLEDQAIGPIANPIEMGNTHEVAVKTIAKIPGYQMQFDAIFTDGLSIENIGKAIAAFERTLVTGPAPWDFFLELQTFERAYAADIEDLDELKEEDEELYNDYMELKQESEANAISESAIRGGELFFSDRSGCTACHVGANFTDEKYHNLGVGMDTTQPDLGRFEQTGEDIDRGAFKTPTVRNVALTAPYMHDGSQQTLEEVVEWYAKGGHPNPYLSEKVKKLDLTEQDKADLVAFMKEGLLGKLPQPEQGRLPN